MFERLKKRRDFLAAAKGRKLARHAFVVEMRLRDDHAPPRVGVTVTKRTADKAVERNRIRRRLKEAVRLAAPEAARPGTDYVLVARRAALNEDFGRLTGDVFAALQEVHANARTGRRPGAQSG